ncbi:MAG: hypothetical protein FWH47_04730 [Methanomassiliicoccaceae archaeon]|nr:hypothetical protein [Methanomassiliicoccaceae archaeon]
MALSSSGKILLAVSVAAVACAVVGASVLANEEGLFDNGPYTVAVVSDNPSWGSVSGGGVFEKGGYALLSATPQYGFEFSGWYSDGRLVSSDKQTTQTITKDITFEGRFRLIHDASFTVTPAAAKSPVSVTMTSTYNVEVSQRAWVVEDLLTGEKLTNTAASGGSYSSVSLSVTKGRALSITHTVTYSDGQKATSNVVKVVDEDVAKHFAWRYQKASWYSFITNLLSINNGSATMDVRLSFAWYYGALTSSVPRGNGFSTIDSYVTYNDPVIRNIAYYLQSNTSGMSDIDRADFVLKFVQSLPYQYDIDGKGKTEYWKLPAETLWEGRGDCEDHAFLYASLMKAMGYRVVLHHVYVYGEGHLAVGVSVTGGSGTYTNVNGVRYYYCEATATDSAGWFDRADVGYMPPGTVIYRTYTV